MIPRIPDQAPFSREQRAWLNGFFAGLYSVQAVDGLVPDAPAPPTRSVTVLFGSQTGTAEGLARKTVNALKAQGFAASACELDTMTPADLVDVHHLLVITSTYGDGEMPDNAQIFWEALSAEDAPRLEQTAFAVCALGDSSYPDFCQAGKDIDARLEALGARRLFPRADCDIDYEAVFAGWLEGVCEALNVPSGDGALV